MNQPKEAKFQFIRFDRGISQYNHDYYAALGFPIVSDPTYIRNVYLRIARILHPDIYGFSADDKAIATQYLAKLVNPAYNALMKEQDRHAYQEIFKLLAKRLMLRSRNIQIHSESACELMLSPSDEVYERLVTEIAKLQYQSLPQILDLTAQISELNLVYILYKEGYQHGAANMPPVLAPMLKPTSPKPHTQNFLPPPSKPSYSYRLQYSFSPQEPSTQEPSTQEPSTLQSASPQPTSNLTANSDETIIQSETAIDTTMIDARIKTCEIHILQNNWKTALQDLRAILRMDENNSKCLALLGVVYTNTHQPEMAKASFKRSLYINPQESLALEHLLELTDPKLNQSKVTKNNSKGDRNSPKPKPTQKPTQKQGWITDLLEKVSFWRS
ncbi:molecular chaperone DnaJ [Pseudanabaena sp. UWO310]|uniref:molecular chaperone DnaJ n=1 Tax=Pseudanabaena sp. UWO310 TaxID=2480795 RepID=UPI0011607CA2|nr:molecular chaperone DnaJ [Pseudanabaena sp. UWO310]TYQ24866.1 molecular chaperone DnaJ [Pseudanabaena sp. UWO310]